MELIVIPIGHAITILNNTKKSRAAAPSANQPTVAKARSSTCVPDTDTDTRVITHDTYMFKSLYNALIQLAQTHVMCII